MITNTGRTAKNIVKKMAMQQHLKIGERGFHLFVNEYNGQPKVHIRKIYQDHNGQSIITRYGVTLSLDEWNELKQSIQAADHQLINLPSLVRKSMTKVPSLRDPFKVQIPSPYQRNSNKHDKYTANNTTILQDTSNDINELFKVTVQEF